MATTENKQKAPITSPGMLLPFIAITAIYFFFGFITNLNQGLVPELKKIFAIQSIPVWQTMLANFAFFLAYLIFAQPTVMLIEKIGYKATMIVAIFVQVAGALLFLPAAQMVSFPLFLVAIFVVGAGVTGLQTSANPYTALLGPEESAATRLNLGQAFNSLGGTLAPLIVGAFILTAKEEDPGVVAQLSDAAKHAYQVSIADTVRLPYIVVAAVLVLLGIAIGFSKLPMITGGSKDDDANAAKKSIWSYRHTVLGALGIFCYVGVEVGLATTMVLYFSDELHGGLHALTLAKAQQLVFFYWGGALVGRLLAPAMLAAVKPSKLLGIFGLAAALLVVIGMVTPGYAAVGALILCGFFNSIMFPTIFALGVAGLGSMTSRGSGLISSAVVGGAIVPVIIGWLVDSATYQIALVLAVACYLYIAWYGMKGSKPVVAN